MTDTPDPGSEPSAAPVMYEPARADAQERPVSSKTSPFLPLVLGGITAAAMGFGAAQVVPKGWPLGDVSGLTATVAAQSEQMAALTSKMEDLGNAPAPKLDPSLSNRLTAIEADLTSLPPPQDMSAVMKRLEAVEQKVAGMTVVAGGSANPVDVAAVAQLQAEIDALKDGGSTLDAKLAEAGSRLDSIKAEAQAVVTQATGRAALHQLQAALDSGAPYGAALKDLAGNPLPEVLTANAQGGLPSLQVLRQGFPDAARAALDASLRASKGDTWTERVSVFLRSQTGTRSLTPREGTDPDAVLSRAEAAVTAGDLTLAMTELAALPDAGKAAMADWLALAAQRQDAVAAVQALTTALGQ
ncbi:MAG: hypothetical protein WCS20_07915 [Alphaproteobacteria bacterium]